MSLPTPRPLRALPPAPFPATTEVARIVADNASVAYLGNRYSVPPGLSGTTLLVRHRLAAPTIDLVALSAATLVTHRLAPAGSGALVLSLEHKEALEAAVLSAFSTAPQVVLDTSHRFTVDKFRPREELDECGPIVVPCPPP